MGQIVVGIDESQGARMALAWAMEEARVRGLDLLALHAWTYPAYLGVGFPTVTPLAPQEGVERVESYHQRMAQEVVGDAAIEGVRARAKAVQGAAGPVLVDASRDAELLVVGSRGLGGFKGLLLGSISRHCVAHAHCPVVVIPRERHRNEEGSSKSLAQEAGTSLMGAPRADALTIGGKP